MTKECPCLVAGFEIDKPDTAFAASEKRNVSTVRRQRETQRRSIPEFQGENLGTAGCIPYLQTFTTLCPDDLLPVGCERNSLNGVRWHGNGLLKFPGIHIPPHHTSTYYVPHT